MSIGGWEPVRERFSVVNPRLQVWELWIMIVAGLLLISLSTSGAVSLFSPVVDVIVGAGAIAGGFIYLIWGTSGMSLEWDGVRIKRGEYPLLYGYRDIREVRIAVDGTVEFLLKPSGPLRRVWRIGAPRRFKLRDPTKFVSSLSARLSHVRSELLPDGTLILKAEADARHPAPHA